MSKHSTAVREEIDTATQPSTNHQHPNHKHRVPHLRDGFIVAKVGMHTLHPPAVALVLALAVVLAIICSSSFPTNAWVPHSCRGFIATWVGMNPVHQPALAVAVAVVCSSSFPTNTGCPIFATVLSSLRWAIAQSAIRLPSR